ncbi:MAG TPA: DUF4097 family beta strand repeat-containing protein [Vicinamibacterales bacterium]|nr:DUF4097 family beta strand repeat-containing protein [Vicinamibacterales bacterium]
MRNLLKFTTFAAASWLAFALPASAQDFQWTGQLAPGQRIEVVGVNGSITASTARDGNIVVTGVKKPGRRGNPAEVRIESVATSDGVTVCVLYGDARCAAGGARSNNSNDGRNDTSVDFTVQVPAGIRLVARTVNGSIDANGLMSDTEASTVNGSVTVATSGTARANTVNGTIKAAMGQFNGGRFSTVNGAVTLQLPAGINADVRASTVSGDITSDFPLQIDAERGPKRAEGTIGAGGQRLDISTVNGAITLARR